MSPTFYNMASVVAEDGRGVLRAMHLHPPTAAETVRDLGVLGKVAAGRTEAGIAYARAISDIGGTDLWADLGRGLDARGGAVGGLSATTLIGEARARVMPRWKGVQQVVSRPRPFAVDTQLETILHRPSATSFPSGHTTGAYVGATIMATLDPANAAKYWAAARDTARSRIYGAVHFPGDVEAAAILAHRTASEVLAEHGIEAAALQGPHSLRLSAYAHFGDGPARDALAAVHHLRVAGPPEASLAGVELQARDALAAHQASGVVAGSARS